MCNAQKLWKITIADSVSLKAIGQVTVMLNKNGFITNDTGVLFIEKRLLKKNDTIKVSSIGYTTKNIKLTTNYRYPDTIFLSPSLTILNEVVIKNQGQKVLGQIAQRYDGGYLLIPDQEIAEYVPNPNKSSGTINSLIFVIKDDHKGIVGPFKVNIYSKDSTMYPGENYLKDSLIVYNSKKRPVVIVDVTKYNLAVPPNGFFVGFESLSPSWYENDVVEIKGHKYFKVPGIAGHFKNHQFNFDDDLRTNLKFSLYRDITPQGKTWSIFEAGTDFAIGATIIPDN